MIVVEGYTPEGSKKNRCKFLLRVVPDSRPELGHFTREKTHDETSVMGARAMGCAPMTEVSSRVFFTSNERKRTTFWNLQKKGIVQRIVLLNGLRFPTEFYVSFIRD
jgi:hypothetical protein